MSFHAAEDGNADIRLDIPEPQGVILAGRQEDIGIPGMELELIDGMSMPNVVLTTGESSRIEDSDNPS